MKEPIGVILLNLGGPETLADVEPFLFNLFSDRTIIRLSPFCRNSLPEGSRPNVRRRVARRTG